MEVKSTGQVGPSILTDGSSHPLRQGKTGELVVSGLGGSYAELASRGQVWRFGMAQTALSANTISLTNTTTPIIGLWNTSNANRYIVPICAVLQISVAGNSAVAPGAFVWATSTGNLVISTGSNPVNTKSWASPGGSFAKGFNIGVALTGLTNNLVIQRAMATGNLVAAQPATATACFSTPNIEYFDGMEMIPPGGVLALLNTTSTTTVSVASAIYFTEVEI
jgi:hypothetical protein